MRLKDVARVIRSKNAGPLALTVDILFENDADYQAGCTSENLSPAALCARLEVGPNQLSVIADGRARAIKIVMARPVVSGSPGDTDVYGAQQHAPFLDIEL